MIKSATFMVGACGLLAFLASAPAAIGAGAGPSLPCQDRPCTYRVSSGPFSFEFGPDSIGCQAVSGAGRFTTATSPRLRLTLRGCREQSTPFTFSCVDMRSSTPRIRSKRVSAVLLAEGGARKLEASGFKVRLVCGGGLRAIIEGFLDLKLEPPDCAQPRKTYSLPTELIGHGGRSINSFYDVLVDGHPLGDFRFDHPWRLTFSSKTSLGC